MQAGPLPADDRPEEELRDLAQALSGNRIDAEGGLAQMDSADLRRAWQALREKSPEAFAPPASRLAEWRRRQAEASEAAGQWFAAAWHLAGLIDDNPEDGSLRQRRAEALGRMADWPTALAEAVKAVELQPDAWEDWYQRGTAEGQLGHWDRAAADLATAFELAHDPDLGPGQAARMRLEAGDLPGYRKECEKLLAITRTRKASGRPRRRRGPACWRRRPWPTPPRW